MRWFGKGRSSKDGTKGSTSTNDDAPTQDSWSDAESALPTLCITQADLSIRWHLSEHFGIREARYQRTESKHIDGKAFDVYEAEIPGGTREYWMNVSYWFGRGLQMRPGHLNLPPPDETTSLLEFFGEPEIRNLPFPRDIKDRLREPFGSIGLKFARYSSHQLSRNVAFVVGESGRPVVQATAIRRYIADSLPLLHGFRFVKPFIVHQAMHVIRNVDFAKTEVAPESSYEPPKPGRKCVSFTPPVAETPANDFWAYMLWGHQPGAFDNEAEREMLTASALTAVASGFVSADELKEALVELEVLGGDASALMELTNDWKNIASRKT